jgi:hypothetical protein
MTDIIIIDLFGISLTSDNYVFVCVCVSVRARVCVCAEFKRFKFILITEIFQTDKVILLEKRTESYYSYDCKKIYYAILVRKVYELLNFYQRKLEKRKKNHNNSHKLNCKEKARLSIILDFVINTQYVGITYLMSC